MNCKMCGAYIGTNTTVCPECGSKNEAVFDGKVCLHCGYKGDLEPAKMIRWYEWIIILSAFPLGLLYLFYIFLTRQEQSSRGYMCPCCKKISKYSKEKTDVNKEQIKTIVKTVATDEEIKKSAKEMKKSIKDLHNTFYID